MTKTTRPNFKSVIHNTLIMVSIIMPISCTTPQTKIYSTSLIQSGENSAYIALGFDAALQWKYYAIVKNENTEEEYLVDFNLPEEERNQVRIMGVVVYDSKEEEEEGKYITSVAFLTPGFYQVLKIIVKNTNTSRTFSVQDCHLDVDNNTITYLGRANITKESMFLSGKLSLSIDDDFQMDMKEIDRKLVRKSNIIDIGE